MSPHLVRFLGHQTALLVSASVLVTAACANLTAPTREEASPAAAKAEPPPAAKMPRPQPVAPDAQPAGDTAKIQASHILVGFKGAMRAKSDRTKEEAKQLAAGYAARAKKGEDFAELARKYSEGPSGPRGGQLNEFSRQQMVKPFADAAFSLKVGEVSDPVETQFGFHIIKRTK